MATVTGFVERIKYRNEENGYTVLSLNADGEEYILVGTFHYISEGEMVEAVGSMIEHPVYGQQLQVESYEIKTPQDTLSVERYLGSGAIKGIGAALASRIVRRFKADTFRIMEEEPERLSEVKGISEKMAMDISRQVEEKKEMRQAMMFLQDYGISMNLAVKIYQQYGARLYSVIKENPYQLADDIPGVGFKLADEIAGKAGILTDSDFRIKCGILYTLLQGVGNGHTYLPKEVLLRQASELLKVEPERMEKHLMDMQMEKRIVIKAGGGEAAVYAAQYYYLELNSARMLHDLNIRGDIPEGQIEAKILKIQQEEELLLDELQKEAVRRAVNCGLLIITGGPGTGKTTTINTIIRFFEQEGMEILTNSPRVREARRTNVELILSQHNSSCTSCVRGGNCSLQRIANDLGIYASEYKKDIPKRQWPIEFPLIRDASRCIKCMRCVQICDKVQDLHIWDIVKTGSRATVGVTHNLQITHWVRAMLQNYRVVSAIEQVEARFRFFPMEIPPHAAMRQHGDGRFHPFRAADLREDLGHVVAISMAIPDE